MENVLHPLDVFPRQRPELAARVIGGEAVVVSPSDARVHELNEVATRVFEACDGTRNGWRLVELVVGAFEVGEDEAARDVAALLEAMRAAGIVELLDAPASGTAR